jgi:hypothetical protein
MHRDHIIDLANLSSQLFIRTCDILTTSTQWISLMNLSILFWVFFFFSAGLLRWLSTFDLRLYIELECIVSFVICVLFSWSYHYGRVCTWNNASCLFIISFDCLIRQTCLHNNDDVRFSVCLFISVVKHLPFSLLNSTIHRTCTFVVDGKQTPINVTRRKHRCLVSLDTSHLLINDNSCIAN